MVEAASGRGGEATIADVASALLSAARERTPTVLKEWRRRESSRLALWSPVAFGAGAAMYLLRAAEPPFWIAALLLTAAIVLAGVLEKWRPVFFAAALFCSGFLVADWRVAAVDAPILEKKTGVVTVVGRLVAVDEAPKLRRLIIEAQSIERVDREKTPARVRVSWRGKAFDARPGDLISVRADLSPPPGPAAPGGFDFARQLYFQRIGAVGFTVSAPVVISEEAPPVMARARSFIETLRLRLARRIIEKAPGDSGAIVSAVITGKREAISERAEAAFRDSGLAHLLSISGLHMGLATGIIFFAVRAALALHERIAVAHPIKKWAAGAALLSGFCYLLISGGAWPAQRAFIMTSIFFIAIIADRRALTLRNVAIAAFLIILMTPEAVLHPGFQMSFAAVTALIAFYEWASARADPARSFSLGARLRRYVVGIGVTDTIAAAATSPYALYHFNRTANFGLPANVISIPVMGFWVMPAAIVAMALMPVGLDGPFWRLAASGVDVILSMGYWTMALPGAVTVFPQWPASALAVLTLGGLWLCLMSQPWRLFGIAAAPLAALLIAIEPHPSLFVSNAGDNAGVLYRQENGAKAIALFNPRKSGFAVRAWMEQAGINSEKSRPAKLEDIASCDGAGCVILIDGARLAISNEPSGLDDDCARADLVIALYPVSRPDRRPCKAKLIDKREAWNEGAHAVHLKRGAIRIESAAMARGARPWSQNY